MSKELLDALESCIKLHTNIKSNNNSFFIKALLHTAAVKTVNKKASRLPVLNAERLKSDLHGLSSSVTSGTTWLCRDLGLQLPGKKSQ